MRDHAIYAAAFAAGIAFNYGLALAGEPSSTWLWCTVLGVTRVCP